MPPDPARPRVPEVRGLFRRHISGDDAILRLARLRFAESGMAAELYADTPEQLEADLRYLPPHPALPVTHLNRQANLLQDAGQRLVEAFISRFHGRLLGVVIHDRPEMADRMADVVTAMRKVMTARQADGPMVFLEYAGGMEPERFAQLAHQLADVEGASVCVDIGHIGIREGRRRLAGTHRGLDLTTLRREGGAAPGLVHDVQAATRSALAVTLDTIESIGAIGMPLHFHLHDGHPLIPGLADHFSFLTRVPVPFMWEGRRSLDPMYGPAGLRQVLEAIVRHCPPGGSSITLEVHQSEGRLPLGDAAEMFAHGDETVNAERMNYWLAVLAQNYLIAASMLESA
jgi:hypothetical protein